MFICLVGFIFGIPFIMQGGFYLFDLVDESATMISFFIILLAEVYIIINDVGIDLLKQLNDTKTKKPIPEYIYYCLEKICPYVLAILGLIAVFSMVFNKVKLSYLEVRDMMFGGHIYLNL
jgi:SNF family Na+-dependent transporter